MALPTGTTAPVPDPPRVLVVGFDPFAVPGLDAEAVDAALRRGQDRFANRGFTADLCLIPLDDTLEATIVESLRRTAYDCVVIGGGIRKPEPCLELFESVVNLVRRHAPGSGDRVQLEPRGQRRRGRAPAGAGGLNPGPLYMP